MHLALSSLPVLRQKETDEKVPFRLDESAGGMTESKLIPRSPTLSLPSYI